MDVYGFHKLCDTLLCYSKICNFSAIIQSSYRLCAFKIHLFILHVNVTYMCIHLILTKLNKWTQTDAKEERLALEHSVMIVENEFVVRNEQQRSLTLCSLTDN